MLEMLHLFEQLSSILLSLMNRSLFAAFLLLLISPYHRCFGCQVLEGYGMTETSCVISCMDEGDTLSGHVGSPNPACGEFNTVVLHTQNVSHLI